MSHVRATFLPRPREIYEKIGLPPRISMPFRGDVIEQGKDDILERALGL
jgi:hypothetical protein